MDFEIKELNNSEQIPPILSFLYSRNSFDMELSEFSKKARKETLADSLVNPHHKFWYIEKNNSVIATIGVCENERRNGGYWLDYFAVHTDYRRNGIGRTLLETAEQFTKELKGRYITIDTGDTDMFSAARSFYEANGYKQVSHFPDYYDEGSGKIDYYKKINKPT